MLTDCNNLLDERIDLYELEKLRDVYERQVKRGQPSTEARFSFAHGLIKSTKEDVRQGITLLEGLLRENADDVGVRDYVYYLAVGHARLKDYDRAKAYIDTLLSAEGGNRQALALKQLIDKKMTQEGLLGAAVLGGGLITVLGIGAALLFSAKKYRERKES